MNMKTLRFTVLLFLFMIACASWLLAPSSFLLIDREIGRIPAHSTTTTNLHQPRWRKVAAVFEGANQESSSSAIDWRKVSYMIETLHSNITNIALVNIPHEIASQWKTSANKTVVTLPHTNISWTELFPEWIDEEQQYQTPKCPNIPLPDMSTNQNFDVIVSSLPCRKPESAWTRDVQRLQAHIATAYIAAKGSINKLRIPILFHSRCRPMLDVFRCDNFHERRGTYYWLYDVDVADLTRKMSLPIGSCQLSLPKDALHKEYMPRKTVRGEAYATILHSSEQYVCGAIVLAQSIRLVGSTKDLVLLADEHISGPHRRALSAAGWKIRSIRRIRNPNSEKDSYNEWNYSKFRLWQLTDYSKVVFIDADLLVLRNVDFLFSLPQVSATGNSRFVFNSGMMVIEPSNCTFRLLMKHRREIVSYNGGDQGYLNEFFPWWHRLPRKMNYLKHFWSNDTEEYETKTRLFGADPPELYVLHYLGIKPWLCYRDYDCNWNVENQWGYASDVAHRTWWKVHDSMYPGLQSYCRLSDLQKELLEWDRSQAELARLGDEHWRINVTDPRLRLRFPK